jgi:hypothetical protein
MHWRVVLPFGKRDARAPRRQHFNVTAGRRRPTELRANIVRAANMAASGRTLGPCNARSNDRRLEGEQTLLTGVRRAHVHNISIDCKPRCGFVARRPSSFTAGRADELHHQRRERIAAHTNANDDFVVS